MDAVLSNIKVLCEFNPVTYPYLSRLFNISSLRRHLCVIWEYMAAHPHPRAKDAHGNGYWSIPVSHLISLHGGTRETWQSHIIFATDAGLLWRVRPDKHSILPELKEEYEEAQAKAIIDAIEARPEYGTEDWLIIITTDHGGINKGHGFITIQERMTFIAVR